MTARTSEDTEIQGHLLAMSTAATCLTRIGRIDFDNLSASFFRFARQLSKEGRPGGICNAFGKTMVMGHAVDMQVFNTDDAKAINDLATFLMGEIVTSECYPFMDTSNNLAMLATERSPLGEFGMLALHTCQGLLFFPEEARISYLFSIGKSSERLQANIYAHLGSDRAKSFRLILDREGAIPFSCRATSDGTGFDFALDGSMVDHLDAPNLGEGYTVIMRDTETTLREGEGVVSALSLETREARFFSMLSDTSEEGLERQINAYGNILKDLRMHGIEGRAFLFQDRKARLLLETGERNTIAFIGRFPHFKQVIIQPTALFKGLVELLLLLLRWKQTVRKHFQQVPTVAQTEQGCKRETAPYLPQTRNALHPHALKAGAFVRS